MRSSARYSHGGAGQLLADFMNGLRHGSPVFWAVALGPYVMIAARAVPLPAGARPLAPRAARGCLAGLCGNLWPAARF